MIIPKSFAENGGLPGLFKVAGFLMSASVALVFGFLGPTRDARGHVQHLLIRVAALVTALATGLIWALASDVSYRRLLTLLATACGIATVLAFIFYQRALRPSQPRNTTVTLLYLTLAISGPVALSSTALLTLLPKPMEASISVPRSDTCFVPNLLVEGTWKNVPVDSDIWVAAGTLDGRLFFPEERKAVKLQNGTWESSFGYNPPTASNGFFIRAMVLNAEARVQFEEYAQDPAKVGLQELPSGAIVTDRIRLNTGVACR